MPADNVEQHDRDTLWKLVDTQCAQLADSVVGARRPFLLALTWAFIWASALYSVDFGHNRHLAAYYRDLSRLVKPGDDFRALSQKAASQTAKEEGMKEEELDKELSELKQKMIDNNKKLETHCADLSLPDRIRMQPEMTARECRATILAQAKTFHDAYNEGRAIALPGGLGRFSVGDLSVVGQLGLLLILSWCFFATRRENHAVRAFVDMDAHSRRTVGWFPIAYVLEPQARFFVSEHFAYAYRSVAQRFVFLFSQHSKPLFAFTALLCTVPALVATWNAYTDIRDLSVLMQFRGGLLPIGSFLSKTIIEVVLLALVWVITYKLVRFDVETSTLLNGWHLAVQDVWMVDRDTARRAPARVRICVPAQTATAVLPVQTASA
jgi:hypothetical protein